MIKYFKLSLLVLITASAQAQAPIEDSIIEYKSACKIEAKEKENILPIGVNFTKMIEGRAPGIQATNGGGQPGSLSSLLIRGDGTNTGNNQPLIVLDGAPYFGDYNAINPNDINTVTILKDAVATMRYGSMGANGIVDIKTKKGKSFGKPELSISATTGIVTRGLSDYKTIKNEKDYYELSWEAYKNGLIAEGFSDAEARNAASGIPHNYGVISLLGYNSYNVADSSLIDPLTGKLNPNAQLKYSDGNWAKAMQRTGLRQDYNAAFSGGGSKGNYYLSAGYLNEEGYVKASDYERFTARFNGEIKPFPWLKGGINIVSSIGNQNNTNTYDDANNPFFASRTFAPIYPVHYYNTSGEREIDPITGTQKYDWGSRANTPESSMGNRTFYPSVNAIGTLALNQFSEKATNWTVAPFVEATLYKEIKIRSQLHYNNFKNKQIIENNPFYGGLAQAGGAVSLLDVQNNATVFTQTINWEKTLGRHNFDITGGYEKYNRLTEIRGESRYGNQLSGGSYLKLENKLNSYFASAAYTYSEKYLFAANARRDAIANDFTTITPLNNWAMGVAWIISQEPFLQDVSAINKLKLKATYGKLGNMNSYAISNLNPENNKHLNIGIELGVLNNRLWLTSEYFIKKNSNLIVPIFYPAPYTTQYVPGMEITNKGIELQLVGYLLTQSNILWTTTLNLTSYKNRITKLPLGIDSVYRNMGQWKKGNSIYDFNIVESAGVDPANGDELYYYTTSSEQREKTNNYSSINGKDRINMGSALPKLFGSLINDIEYKNFTFSFMFTFGLGGKYYDGIYQELMGTSQLGKNYSEDMLNRWTPENTNTNVPRMEVYNQDMAQTSSRFLVDASYLNWRNASLGYNFSESKLKKIKLSSLKVYIAGDNLLLFSARKGMDPQAVFNNNPGYVYNPARTLILGLKVGI